MQTWASVEHGTWYARSAEFMSQGIIHNFVWLRVIGDTIFAIGVLVLGLFSA
jgi:nitric oxide reductase subunit B